MFPWIDYNELDLKLDHELCNTLSVCAMTSSIWHIPIRVWIKYFFQTHYSFNHSWSNLSIYFDLVKINYFSVIRRTSI